MTKATILFAGALMISGLIFHSCASVENSGSDVVSHDNERQERLDSLSAVKADTVVIQHSFGKPGNKPAKRKIDN